MVLAFAVMMIVYFIINFFYYRALGINVFPYLADKRFWFNFIVMNVWQFDIGNAIWYVQALLYAYIIIYFLDKLKLLKYDWIISAVLIVFTIVTGELCGVIRWNVLDYYYIPGNFFTRALPYVLLGGVIHRNMNKFKNISSAWYRLAVAFGILLMFGEIILFGNLGVPGYYGHLLGMPIAAASVCILAFKSDNESGFESYLNMSRWHTNLVYYMYQPVGIGIALLIAFMGNEVFGEMYSLIGILTFLVCFGIAWLIAYFNRKVIKKEAHGQKN